MNTSIKPLWTETLPDPLPANPLEIAADWLAQAVTDAAQPNPNAMVLATVNGQGQPSARVVLCKEIVAERGTSFLHDYESHKGRDLKANPRAAVVFHWDHRHRRFAPRAGGTRARKCQRRVFRFPTLAEPSWRVGKPPKRADRLARTMGENVAAAARRFGIPYGGPGTPEPDMVVAQVPRPPHWGGFG